MTGTNMKSVGGTLIAIVQHCTQGLHATTVGQAKTMDQGKKEGNTFTQETVWEL